LGFTNILQIWIVCSTVIGDKKTMIRQHILEKFTN
jgi:hypothetical protein